MSLRPLNHVCHAMGCSTIVPPHLLMCAPHWGRVPVPLRRIVWREYRPGQERDKRPSARYLVVQAFVVAIVARAEGLMSKAESHDFIEQRVRSSRINQEEGFQLIIEMQGN